MPAIVRVVEDARTQPGMDRLTAASAWIRMSGTRSRLRRRLRSRWRTLLALSLTILVRRFPVAGGAAGAVGVMASGAGSPLPRLIPGSCQRIGAVARRSGLLESFLLLVGGGHQILDLTLQTKMSLTFQAVELREGSFSRPQILRRRVVRGLDEVERRRVRIRRKILLPKVGVAGCGRNLPSTMTNLRTAAVWRLAMHGVELVNRILNLARHGDDRFAIPRTR